MLFIKLIKVENLTCSKLKHHLMLCNKIEINKLERFTQTIEIETSESDHFTQTRMRIYIFELLSESYIQKKTFRVRRTQKHIQDLEILLDQNE